MSEARREIPAIPVRLDPGQSTSGVAENWSINVAHAP